VPLSTLQGQPTPVTVTVGGRDVVGQIASPWKPDDVAAALAVVEADNAECPGCGGDLAKTTDPQHQFDWQAETIRCHNCATRAAESEGHDNRAGLLTRSWFEADERVAR